MGGIIGLFFDGVLILTVLFCLFLIVVNIDFIIEFIHGLIIKLKDEYEYFRQRFCKKSNKVNDDTGAIYNDSELFDSSSEWED